MSQVSDMIIYARFFRTSHLSYAYVISLYLDWEPRVALQYSIFHTTRRYECVICTLLRERGQPGWWTHDFKTPVSLEVALGWYR